MASAGDVDSQSTLFEKNGMSATERKTVVLRVVAATPSKTWPQNIRAAISITQERWRFLWRQRLSEYGIED